MNNNLNIYESLHKHLLNARSVVFLDDSNDIEIDTTLLEEIREWFNEHGFSIEPVRGNKIRVKIDQFPFSIYWNDDFFLQRIFRSNSFNRDIAIINLEKNSPRFFDCQSKSIFINFTPATDNYFFPNTQAYLECLGFLEDKSQDAEEAFHFVDHFSKDNRRMVFTSMKELGRVVIDYKMQVPHFQEQISLAVKTRRLYDAFTPENKHFPKFIKNELIAQLSKIPKENRIIYLFENLDTILDAAEINFEIYLNDLSIESLKKEYLEYKDKYFERLSSILNKLTTQVIGLPVTISASAFAVYKSSDSVTVLFLILGSIIALIAYFTSLLNLYAHDVSVIESDFNTDYQRLKKNNFFVKKPEELNEFEVSKEKIKGRINYVRRFIYSYYIVMVLFNLLVIIYIFTQLINLIITIALVSIVILIILSIIFYFYLYNIK